MVRPTRLELLADFETSPAQNQKETVEIVETIEYLP